jgi:outer membrane receptor protein involved in Fe transport
VSHSSGRHAPSFGINFIHEPVLSGALSGTADTVLAYPEDPSFYTANPSEFFFSPGCVDQPDPASGISCTPIPAGDGTFSQSVRRLGLYAQDSWRVTRHLTVNYGLRYDTTFGLFAGSGRSQLQNRTIIAGRWRRDWGSHTHRVRRGATCFARESVCITETWRKTGGWEHFSP